MLKCEHLVKKYITTTAISDLSLEIEPGHIYALLGPNGSGKSTLMKIIAGLVKPDSGTITIDGVPMTYRSKKDIAYMPTEAFFFGYMNCKDIGKYYKDFFDDFDYDKYMGLLLNALPGAWFPLYRKKRFSGWASRKNASFLCFLLLRYFCCGPGGPIGLPFPCSHHRSFYTSHSIQPPTFMMLHPT